MKIARFLIKGRPAVAVDGGEGFVDFGAILEARGWRSEITGADPERRLINMLRRGMLDEDFILEQMEWLPKSGQSARWRLEVDGLAPLLPLRPPKIICLARNWVSHAREQGHELPDRPVYFAKTENAAIGPGEPIRIPGGIGRVEHEGELGVVISNRASGVAAGDAGKFILGYTIVNDVTARELQRDLAREGRPWFAAKSMDSFAPIGPWIVTRSQMEPLSSKRIRVAVNGELRQDGILDDMHWGVEQLIEAITRYITLRSGDIIATGTPSGVGELKPGDEVVVEIDGIGQLVNPVVEG